MQYSIIDCNYYLLIYLFIIINKYESEVSRENKTRLAVQIIFNHSSNSYKFCFINKSMEVFRYH